MTFRRLIRQLMPPVMVDAYRRLRPSPLSPPYWSGIYEHHRDVPTSGAGIDSDAWAEVARKETEAALAEVNANGVVAGGEGERGTLPFLAAVVHGASGRVRILDFGGGAGGDYARLRASIGPGARIEYHVVDTERMCREGGKLFAGDRGIAFSSTLPPDLRDVDIVYVNSALQYLPDYRAALTRLCAYRPAYVLLVRLSAGAVPTYASVQQSDALRLPYWFLALDEVMALMAGAGYALLFKSVSATTYDQGNFPPAYRLGRTCTLLFSRRACLGGA